jgi:tripartite-type tricarboxylate transporter receptor subunit TctC
MTRRTALLALACLCIGATTNAVSAQTWPTRPIKAYIPFSAGSATDIIPRAVFDRVAAELGQPIVIENRGGAGGTIGVGAVVKADPDGYTILANSSAHTVAPSIIENLPYDTAKDLSAVVALGKNANILVVSPAKGWKTFRTSSLPPRQSRHDQLWLRRGGHRDPHQRRAFSATRASRPHVCRTRAARKRC